MCVNEHILSNRLNSNLKTSQRSIGNSSTECSAVFNILRSVLVILFLFLLASVGIAQAAVVGGKELCDGSPGTTCTAPSNNPKVGAPVYYSFTIDNSGGPQDTVVIIENYPVSFTLADPTTPVICSVTQGTGTVNTTFNPQPSSSPLTLSVDIPPNSIVICVIAGYFNTPGAVAINIVEGPTGAPSQVNTLVNSSNVLPTDLSIKKSVVLPLSSSINLSGGPQTVRYRIEITTSKDIYLGDYIQIFDQLQLFPSSISIEATYDVGSLKCYLASAGALSSPVCEEGSVMSGTVKSKSPAWQDFVSWGLLPNQSILLTSGDTLVLEYDVVYDVNEDFACVIEPNAEGINNHAFLGLAGDGQAISDDDNTNNDTITTSTLTPIAIETGIYNVDPNCAPIAGGGPASPLTLEKLRNYPLSWEPSITTITEFFNRWTLSLVPGGAVNWGDDVDYYIRITNTSTTETITKINLEDFIINLPSTPNFKVTLTEAIFLHCPTGSTCTQTTPTPPTPPSGPAHNIFSYYDSASIWQADINQLAPGESAVMKIVAKIGEPWCDASSLLKPKNIRNRITAKYTKVTFVLGGPDDPPGVFTNYTLSDDQDIEMEDPEPCDFSVSKTVTGTNKVEFGIPLTYDVKYTNAGNTEVKIGTLIDALRIANDFYAVELPITFSYQCSKGLSPGLGVTNFSPSGNGSGFLNHVSAPHQGIRVMDHPGFVTFPPNSTLNCSITVTIDKPDASDPYCFSDGNPEIQNLALMDGSLFYNANLPWAPSPEGSNWATVNSPLPKCYNLVVNKSVTPIVTSPNGGPLTYTISVTNPNLPGTNGDLNFTPGSGPTLTDEFTSVLPVSTPMLQTDPCLAANTHPCDWLPNFGSNPTKMAISELAAGNSIVYDYQVTAPYNPHEICNEVNAEMLLNGEPNEDWYVKNPAVLKDNVCVPIRGSLEVTKTFAPGSQAPPPGAVFTVQVECVDPSGNPNLSSTLSLTPGNLSAIQNSIPIGSNCTITEFIDPSSSPLGCVWDIPKYPDGQTIFIDGTIDPHRLSVENNTTCNSCFSTSPLLAIEKNTVSCVAPDFEECTFEIILTNTGSIPFNCPVSILDIFGGVPIGTTLTVVYSPSPVGDWICQSIGPAGNAWAGRCDTMNGIDIQIPPSGSYQLLLGIQTSENPVDNCAYLIVPPQNPMPSDCNF